MAINGAGIGQAADQKGMYEDLFSFRKIAKQYFRKKSQGENPYEDAELLGTIGKRPLEVGDEAHFFGIKCYANKHPEGAGAGLNAICMGNNSDGQQIFMALGLDKPLTELEIYRYLIDDYNQERTALDLASIQKANRPISHGRTENPYMQRYYTVDERDLELFAEYPDLFLKRWTANQHGFEPGSARGINLSRLAAIRDDVVA